MFFSRTARNRLLWATLASIVVPWTLGEGVKRWQQAAVPADPARGEMLVDFIVAGSVVASLTIVLTVAVGCWVTAVLKGPRRVADSFPLDSPRD